MRRARRIISRRPVTYRGALLAFALGMCVVFALMSLFSVFFTIFGVPWDWHAIRFGLLFGAIVGGPQMLYDVHKRRSRCRAQLERER
jgi:hypothetical protein